MTMGVKQEFIQIFQDNIKRQGADMLLQWLVSTDFFIAPASTKYHCAFEGGLALHSINVYKILKSAATSTAMENIPTKVLLYADFCTIYAKQISIP